MTTTIQIPAANPITPGSKIQRALEHIEQVIAATEGGRNCSTPAWSNMQACRLQLMDALKLIEQS